MNVGIFPLSASLFRRFLSRYRVQGLADAARKGDAHAIHDLTALLCSRETGGVQEAIVTVLRSLRSPEAVDCFCHEALLHHNPAPANLAIDQGFAPSEPSVRAVFYFITNQQERLASLDPALHHPLLARGYSMAHAEIRAGVRSVTRVSQQSALFARMIMGSGDLQDPAEWSPEEWELIADGLARESRYGDLWSLLFSAPPSVAFEALRVLQRSGWRPSGDEPGVMEEIEAALPDRWTCPVPAVQDNFSFDKGGHQTVRLALSPDGSMLASGDCTGTVKIWQTGRGSQITLPPGGSASVCFLAFSQDGEFLLVCGEDGLLCSHIVHDGSLRWSRRVWSDSAIGCYASGEEIFVTGEHDGTLTITEILTGLQRTLTRGTGIPVTSLFVLSPGNGKIAAGYSDGSICVRNTVDGSVLMSSPGTGDPVRSLAQGNGTLVVIRETQPPVSYDLAPGGDERVYGGGKSLPGCFAAAGNGAWFSLAGTDHSLRIWQHPASAPAAVIPFYNRGITCSIAGPDGSLLFCGCSEGTLRAYRMPEARLLWEKKPHGRAVATIAISPNRSILASAGWDGTVSLHDPATGKITRTLQRNPGAITGLALTPCGSYIVCGHVNGTASVYDLQYRRVIRSFELYTPQVKTISLSPDGRILASAGGDSTLRLWDISDGSLIAGLGGLTTTAKSLVFAPGSRTLFAGGWDGKLRLWSVPEGRLLKTRAGHASTITCCAVTPDGTCLVTGSNDTTAVVWSLPGLERLETITRSRSEISAVAISTTGDLFAAGNADSVIRLFRLPSGADAGAIQALPGKVTALVFTQDDSALVVGYDTGTIAVFTCPAGHLIHSTGAHPAAIAGLSLIPGGAAVISAGGEGEIRINPLPWTRALSTVRLEEMSDIAEMAGTARFPGKTSRQWHFLHTILAARFRHEIGLCALEEGLDTFDIQIVG
jgi:WD40 repeat protein